MPAVIIRALLVALLGMFALCGPGRADAPHVVADIAPVHSLLASVMQGVADPDLLVGAGMSPHAASLRPSAAKALSRADLVVWIGPELEPWLQTSMASLSPDARSLALLTAPGTDALRSREGGMFHDHEGGHETGHEDDHAAEGDHDTGHDDHEDTETGLDPHAWLDPEAASVWVGLMADNLAEIDPQHAETYQENAARTQQELAQLSAEIRDLLTPAQGLSYIVYHDAFQYFGHRFDLPALAAVSDSEARTPGARRISALRADLAGQSAQCAVTDPQFDTRLLTTVGGGDIPVIELDPLGTEFTPGPGLYADTLRHIAHALSDCGGARGSE